MNQSTDRNGRGERVAARLELLLDVGRALYSVLDITALLGLIADKTAELLEAERCSIFVVDEKKGVLWTQAATGTERITIPITTGLAGAVARTGKIINVLDAYADDRFNAEVDRQTGFVTRNLLSGPMFNQKGEIIGVFQLLNKRGGSSSFTSEDEDLLKALSGFAGNALENALLYTELKATFHSVLEVLSASVDARHHYTAGHTARVADLSCGIAREMRLSAGEVEVLRVAAYLHDYGKIGVRDSILTKPGALTKEEYQEMKGHAAMTQSILSRMHFARQYEEVPAIAGAHHERYDGKGYPTGLSGETIPLGARIMAVADVYDALTTDREYRKAMTRSEALDLMRRDLGTAFDPAVFQAFERLMTVPSGDGR